jgi:peptidoglycan/xylan/chitin deacetylase (PgdA/CDA1 family)
VLRRSFLQSLRQLGTAAIAARSLERWSFADLGFVHGFEAAPRAKSGRPQVALTMDDPKTNLGTLMTWKEANKRLLEALDARRLKAALFVCGTRVDSPEGKDLLSGWDAAGHLLCSHSYSHRMYMNNTSYDEFAADFLRNQRILAPYRNRTPLFRYPLLKEGDTAEKRDHFRALLKEHGYRSGEVTIDASDWYVDDRMVQRLKQNPEAKREPYRDFLVAHLLDRASFYRRLALDVMGTEIRHTLIVHYRMINALFLPNIMTAFEKAGWEWIDASQAFADPVYAREPKTLPAGESLVWAIASETGKFKDRLRWPGEDGDYEKPKMDTLGL